MKYKRVLSTLTLVIAAFSVAASLAGLLTDGGPGPRTVTSVGGGSVLLYGEGLYQNESVSVAVQGKASDLVTLVLAAPLLLASLAGARRGSFRARLLLTGTLAYFLYTYTSYTFLCMYNRLFLVYVLLMSASFFAFVMSLMSFDLASIRGNFSPRLPVKYLGGFQLFVSAAVGLLWLGKIGPSILNGTLPAGLEHYTTLVIQGLDLGFVVPAAALSGILLMKKEPFGYLLSSVIILKWITMLASITAMMVSMSLSGVAAHPMEYILFSTMDLLAVISLVILMKNTAGKASPPPVSEDNFAGACS